MSCYKTSVVGWIERWLLGGWVGGWVGDLSTLTSTPRPLAPFLNWRSPSFSPPTYPPIHPPTHLDFDAAAIGPILKLEVAVLPILCVVRSPPTKGLVWLGGCVGVWVGGWVEKMNE